MERSAFKIGVYGGATLWCLKEREGTYITFNGLRIARREQDGSWWPLENGWKVESRRTRNCPRPVRRQRWRGFSLSWRRRRTHGSTALMILRKIAGSEGIAFMTSRWTSTNAD